jgi:hypothetical protein
MSAIVSGDDLEDAERRFFDAWVEWRPIYRPEPPPATPPPPPPRVSQAPDIIGLFPEPGAQPVSVAIVDYGSGNLHSAAKAFERAARDAGLDQPIVVTSDPGTSWRADRVVLPGVGAFADCRRGLDASTAWSRRLTRRCGKKAGRSSASASACNCWPSAAANTR